ncbi:MAG: PQQ-binding-like beta-propeller repeat protein [Chloroflexi bacterium]|nr:PQQ-binding-like beta-propeller repeat protein [Chloroflexota bacterium]
MVETVRQWLMRDRSPRRQSFVDYSLTLPLQLAWETAVSGSVVSQATFADGVVYVNTYSRLYALDAQSGRVLWDFKPLQSRLYDEKYSTNNSTPAIWQNRIYITDFGGLVYCVNRQDGSAIWEHDSWHASNESICIYGDRLFLKTADPGVKPQLGDPFTTFGYLCLTLDGEQLWFVQSQDRITTEQPVIVDDTLIFGDAAGFLYGVNVENGNIIWQTNTTEVVQITGYDQPIFPFGLPVTFQRSVILQVGVSRVVCGFDAKTGNYLWQYETARRKRALACDESHIYYVTPDGGCGCIRGDDGHPCWFADNAGYHLAESLAPSGLVIGSYYFAGFNTPQKLVAFNTDNGHPVWNFSGNGGFAAGPIFADGRLIVGCDDQHVYCFIEE